MIDSAEYSLIGSILLYPSCLDQVRHIVKSDDFRLQQSKEIYLACCLEADAGRGYDRTIIENVPGIDDDYVSELVNITVTSALVERYANLVHERAVRARAKGIAADLAGMPDEADCKATIEAVIDKLSAVMESTESNTVSSSQSIMQYYDWIQKRSNGESNPMSTGIPALDKIFGGGFEKGGMYVFGARPGVGKSSVGLTIANFMSAKHTVLYVTLEMPTEQMDARRIAMKAGMQINTATGLFGLDDADKWAKIGIAASELSQRKLFYNGSASCSVSDVKLMAKQIKADAVFIDYLGLLSVEGKFNSRYEKTTCISGKLKQMALALNIPVIALAQLNRQAANSEPSLQDLRDSGSIEQDADSVVLLYRPEKDVRHDYGEFQPMHFIVAKNRNGDVGKAIVRWNGATGRMIDDTNDWKSWTA